MWHDYVIEEYRRHAGVTEPAEVQHLLQLVQDYTNLVHDVHHERELLLSYNIGVDRDARQRRMVQSTAARVGLRLPTTDDGQAFNLGM
ncbi:g11288 [Coccomyxa viridis]|uniref:G11288 protein n=1 Tax=Coccomyxa viridis TaxID=1274662 RepID=A0ABP1G7J1_9CHLO